MMDGIRLAIKLQNMWIMGHKQWKNHKKVQIADETVESIRLLIQKHK